MEWKPNDSIVTQYRYGPKKWDIDLMAPDWNVVQSLEDEEYKNSLRLGLIDFNDVPPEAYTPAVMAMPPRKDNRAQMSNLLVKISHIDLEDVSDQDVLYVPIYVN